MNSTVDIITTSSSWYIDKTGYNIVGGIKEYPSKFGNLPLFFGEQGIYTYMYKKSTEPITKEAMCKQVRKAIKKHDEDYPNEGAYYTEYLQIYNGIRWQQGVLDYLGLNTYVGDMLNVYDDILDLWDVEEVPVGMELVI